MAAGRFTCTNFSVHFNLFDYRLDRAKNNEKEKSIKTDLAPYTIQFVNGLIKRLHRC